ncbi:hypothetical protein EES37_29305 [Streptomyces sp. ADI91-18]|nr:hypothetical protein EES37_29305 [Streptomyces sp. ADI91-18]
MRGAGGVRSPDVTEATDASETGAFDPPRVLGDETGAPATRRAEG